MDTWLRGLTFQAVIMKFTISNMTYSIFAKKGPGIVEIQLLIGEKKFVDACFPKLWYKKSKVKTVFTISLS